MSTGGGKAAVRRITLFTLLLLVAVAGGCGGEASEPNLVEAREHNVVELDGIRYRVVMFRQLNPELSPDRALIEGRRPGGKRGLFAAFVVACNTTDAERVPTSRIHLENAFGQVYRALEPAATGEFAYEPRPIPPGGCMPREDSAAARTLPGAAVLFAVPFDDLGERPFVLELRAPDGEGPARRVKLDL